MVCGHAPWDLLMLRSIDGGGGGNKFILIDKTRCQWNAG